MIGRPRRRYAVGEIVGKSRNWLGSYWFVKSHGKDYIKPPHNQLASSEILEHYPTGIKYRLRTDSIRHHGNLGRLNLQKNFTSIYQSVASHHMYIFHPNKRNRKEHKNYDKMPFQKEWNPKLGGSFLRATWEIEKDIGDRPSKKHHLSIIQHNRGFVRGNLRWDLYYVNQLEKCIRKAKVSRISKEDVLSIVDVVYS